MAEAEKPKASQETETAPPVSGPLVFISHDTRDADLAESFSKLLKSVSAGMIKTFRSSDKKGTEGIDFGEDWYKRLMLMLQSTSDVVCLFTERSIDRPWILFEAGVAKGKLNTPVMGIALGVPLGRVSAGPFYQFQNIEDSEADLTKLVNQLARRVSGLELDPDVVSVQVAAFKKAEAEVLKKIGVPTSEEDTKELEEESVIAKLAEEMKGLPTRVAERLFEMDDAPFRRRRVRRFHPMMIDELMHRAGSPGDPVAILMAASLVRDDAPWLYELAMEVYRAIKSGDPAIVQKEIKRMAELSEVFLHGPFAEEFGIRDKEMYMLLREFPRMLFHALETTSSTPKVQRARLRPPRIQSKP